MIIYEVNLKVNHDCVTQFKKWLVIHINTMLSFPGFKRANLLQTHNQEQDNFIEFVVIYFIDTLISLEIYLDQHALEMRRQANEKFAHKFTVTRRIHEHLANFTKSEHRSMQTIGSDAEIQAKSFLLQQGLRWLTSNYQCHSGEIDLIMQDGQCLVFVEVKKRRSDKFGGAIASITPSKQKKIIKTAQYYQLNHKQHYNITACRFDVVTLQGEPPQIDWIKNCIMLDR